MADSREVFRNKMDHLLNFIIENNLDGFKSLITIDDLNIKFNYASRFLRFPFTGTLVPFLATQLKFNFIEYLLENLIIPNKEKNMNDIFQLGRAVSIIFNNTLSFVIGREKIPKIIQQCIDCHADLSSQAHENIPEEFLEEVRNSPMCSMM